MNCKVCGVEGAMEPLCLGCARWWSSPQGVFAEIVKNRATKEYTPGATNGKLQYHVRVKSWKNRRILVSSEMYVRRRSAVRCLELLGFEDWRDVDES